MSLLSTSRLPVVRYKSTRLAALITAAVAVLPLACHAASEYSNAVNVIKADRKAALEKCEIRKGADRALCKVEAKGAYEIAHAELRQKYTPSAKHAQSLAEAKANAQYEIGKQKCSSLAGNERDVCRKDVKTAWVSARANAKTARVNTETRGEPNHAAAVAKARAEGKKDTQDAAYDAAKERCDTFSGDAKDKCVAEVKTRFGK